MIPFICNSYRTITTKILSIHFNYLFLLLLISLETTSPHVRRCPFIFAVLYTKQMAGLYIWSPTLWHAVYHKPAVYTFSVWVMVSSLIQISTWSATINKPGEYLYKPWAFDTIIIYLYMCVILVSVNISE